MIKLKILQSFLLITLFFLDKSTNKFVTKTIKSTTSPIWNDEFEIKNVEEDDLMYMSAEITILNR